MHRIRVVGLAAALALGAVACDAVDAAPRPSPDATPPPVAAIEIAGRLSAEADGRTPDLHGLAVDQALVAAAGAGVRLRVVEMGPDLAVSAQYPPPGDVLPEDGVITVWRGQPPVPPAPVALVGDPSSPAGGAAEEDGSSASDPEPTPPPRSSVEPSPAPAAPPRVNPGRLPEAEVGVVMTGLASWYGEEFAGRGTACGTVFDPAQLTLATRELRCGTVVRITGPGGATVDAVATDWGPAEWTGRRFDLSAATFAAIAHPGAGVVTVSVEVIAP